MIVIPTMPFVLPLAVLGWLWMAARLHRTGRLDGFGLVTVTATIGYAAAVLALTMFPLTLRHPAGEAAWLVHVNLEPIVTIDAPTFNLNVLMLIPLGMLLPLLVPVRSWTAALVGGALVSVGIETVQFGLDIVVGADRTADVNDVIANSIGAVFGFALYLIAAATPRLGSVLRRCTLWLLPASDADRALARVG